jgi:hypothetical protein
MSSTLKGKPRNAVAWPRLHTRVFPHQEAYVKAEVKKSRKKISEGEVYRALIDEAINNRKKKKS